MGSGPEIEELDWHPERTGSGDVSAPPPLAADARIGGSSATVVWSVALVAVLVVVAILKPWGATGRTEDTAPGTTSAAPGASGLALAGLAAGSPAATAPAVTPSPTLPPGAVDCGAPDGWRLVTVGWLAGRPAEDHAAVEPVAVVSGPADPRIPSLPAGQAPLAGVGACRPWPSPSDAAAVVAPRIAAAWRLDGGASSPLSVAPKGPFATSATVSQLYGPVGAATGDWPPGRYVLELVAADLPSPAWVGFDLTAPPPSAASPGP